MINITKKTFENNDIEVIIDGVNALQLNQKHIEENLSYQSLPAITNKYNKIYKKHRYALVDEPIKTTKQKIFTY